MLNEEKRPFLDEDGEGQRSTARTSPQSNRSLIISLVANIFLLAACLLLSGTVFFLSENAQEAKGGRLEIPEPYSPANAVIEYEYRGVIRNDSRFMGHPGPEWEKSMHELMAGTLIRISDEELKLAGSDSIPLKGGGFAAELGVGHNLHCVVWSSLDLTLLYVRSKTDSESYNKQKQIKMFLYREHFYPNMNPHGEDFDYLQSHADHCLDFIRQGILCHLDYSLYTVYWGERRQDIPTHRDPPVQKCVNWSKLKAWMKERAANIDDLVRP